MTSECNCNIPLGLCHQVVVRTPVFSVVRKMSSHPVSLSRLFFAPLLVFATIAGCSSKEGKPAPPPLGVTVTAVVQKDVPIHQELGGSIGEASTSLSAHQELAKAYAEQLNSVVAYREPVRLSSIRYDSGLASYLEIIDAGIQMYSAERSAIIYDLGRKEALVYLYRALGAVAGT